MDTEPTIVERLEAEAAAATEQVSAIQAEMDALKAAHESYVAEASAKIESLSAEITVAAAAVETAKQDAAASLELAEKAEARAKLAEGALARDPDALKAMGLPGAESPVAGLTADTGAGDPKTWPEALAACAGDYVTARRRYPAAFDSQFKK
jgi:FtsZ-binding cell division protein ZapB